MTVRKREDKLPDPAPAPDLSGLLELSRIEHLDLKPVILRVQTDLFVRAASRDQAATEIFESLACALIPMVDEETVHVVAEKLGTFPETPPAVLEALAARGVARDTVIAPTPSSGLAATPDDESGSAPRLKLASREPVEVAYGAEHGERIDREEGLRHLVARALPLTLEEWAGPLAGPTELEARLGVTRSTLRDWRHNRAAICLFGSTREPLFPLAQFVAGRPVAGLAEVVAIIGDPRTAWLWLVEPYLQGGSPLEDLKRGHLAAVIDAARDDFA